MKQLAKYKNQLIQYSIARGVVPIICVMSLIAGAVFYVAYSFILSPRTEDITTLEASISRLEAENAASAQIERNEPQFNAEFRHAVELYKSALPLVPSNTEVSNVLAQVQLAAQQNSVVLTGFNALKNETASTSANKFYERAIPAFALGTHAQVRRFFEDVARLRRIVLITEFDETSLNQKVQVAFTLVPFNAPPQSEIPPLPPALAALLNDTSDAAAPPPSSSPTPVIVRPAASPSALVTPTPPLAFSPN